MVSPAKTTAILLTRLMPPKLSGVREVSRGSHQGDMSRASRMQQRLLFARNFFQHPRMLGSLIPSSRFLVDRLLNKIDWARAGTVVEYGPGVGTITSRILARMCPQSRLVVFEMNEDFVGYLLRTFPDSRLHVVHGSAETVQKELDRLKLAGADYIISGIPYTTMPASLRETIMRESRAALNPGGAVLVYQFTRAVLPHLRTHFRHVHQDFEPRNILPARLFYCTQELA
jgi:phospholipid N-methyltransferase